MALEKIVNNSENNAVKNGLINEECIEMLNFRITEEDKSARLYHNMYMFLNNKGYTGAGALWHKYGHEEEVHSDWAKNYLLDLGIQPELRELPAIMPKEYKSFPEVIRLSYDHEVEITRQCKEFAACAMKNGDHMLYQLAAKFLSEQIEEIGKMQTWLDKLAAFGESPESLRLLDNEMGELANG
jgi:ferritin